MTLINFEIQFSYGEPPRIGGQYLPGLISTMHNFFIITSIMFTFLR